MTLDITIVDWKASITLSIYNESSFLYNKIIVINANV